MMIDSSLIYMTEFCPADAGRKAPGPRSESGAVSVQTWPPDVPICPSVCWTYFLQSATGNRKARRISPSLPSFSFWSLSGCLFVCSATATSSFFLSFSSLGEKMLFAHTRLMCYTWANPRDSRSQSLNKSPPPPPSKPDAVICVQCLAVYTSTDADSCYLSYRGEILVWDWCNFSPTEMTQTKSLSLLFDGSLEPSVQLELCNWNLIIGIYLFISHPVMGNCFPLQTVNYYHILYGLLLGKKWFPVHLLSQLFTYSCKLHQPQQGNFPSCICLPLTQFG